MKLSSSILGLLLQATGRQTGRQALQAQDLEMPPQVVAAISAVGPVSRFSGFDVTVTQSESFICQFSRSQGAAAAQVISAIVSVGRGPWRFTVSLESQHDYTLVPTSNNIGSAVLLQDDTTTAATTLIAHRAVVNVPRFSTIVFNAVFSKEPWVFQLANGPTGVGQTAVASGLVIGERLL